MDEISVSADAIILQVMRSQFLYQDLEKGVFYLINKQTGHKQQAHKDGSPLKTFKVDVTGHNYQARQHIPHTLSLHQPKLINQTNTPPNHSISLPKKTIENRSNSRVHDSDSVRKAQSRNQGAISHKIKMKSVESQLHFVTGLQSTQEKQLLKSSSEMGNLLKSFSKMKESKIYQNHSILHRNEGRVFKNKLINSKGFRQTQNIIYKPNYQPNKLPNIANPSMRRIPLQTVTEQLSKQRKLFLQFHPLFQQRQNKKLVQQQIQRKKNIKKLESLFLQSAERTTNKIYE